MRVAGATLQRVRRAVVAISLLVAGIAHADADRDDALVKLLARTDAVSHEVSKIRGLPLKHPIPNEIVDKAELRARLIAEASDRKTEAEMRAEGLGLARWGLIPLDTDYEKLVIDLLTEQIAGYYDPKTKRLSIARSSGDDADWAEMVLAHEIDHGLQDQSYDLQAFEKLPPGEDDASLARDALVEGDGIALMIEVMLSRLHRAPPWSDPEVANELTKAMDAPGAAGDASSAAFDRAPLAVREAMLFPYRAGLGFVAALRRRHAWTAIDAAFKRPPRSTEQILHPDLYLADDRPVPVTAGVPPVLAGYAIAESTVWGELGFDLFLRSHGVGELVASEAAAGWGGDRVITLAPAADVATARPEHAVGLARFEWDSEVDAIEAYDAATRAMADAVLGATVDHGYTQTSWLALDGTFAWVERRGPSLVIAIGVPAWAEPALLDQAWTATGVARPGKRAR